MLFDHVPEVSHESSADELQPLLHHLKESIDFWKGFYEEENKSSSKAIHKRCYKAVDSLHQMIKNQSEGQQVSDYKFKLTVLKYTADTNWLAYKEAKALAVHLVAKEKVDTLIYAHYFK